MQQHLLTTTQAAEQAGLTRDAIRRAILRGYLPARKLGRDWFIHPNDLNDYLAGRHPGYATRTRPANDRSPAT